MPSSSINVPTLAAGVKMTVPLTNFKATANAATQLVVCTDPTDQHADITSVKVTETTGVGVKVDVGYQKDSMNQLAVASLASDTCYQLALAIATRFGGKTDGNADKTDPFVKITCLAPTGTNCVLKYEVVGECVEKSSCPLLPSTANTITVSEWLQCHRPVDYPAEHGHGLEGRRDRLLWGGHALGHRLGQVRRSLWSCREPRNEVLVRQQRSDLDQLDHSQADRLAVRLLRVLRD